VEIFTISFLGMYSFIIIYSIIYIYNRIIIYIYSIIIYRFPFIKNILLLKIIRFTQKIFLSKICFDFRIGPSSLINLYCSHINQFSFNMFTIFYFTITLFYYNFTLSLTYHSHNSFLYI